VRVVTFPHEFFFLLSGLFLLLTSFLMDFPSAPLLQSLSSGSLLPSPYRRFCPLLCVAFRACGPKRNSFAKGAVPLFGPSLFAIFFFHSLAFSSDYGTPPLLRRLVEFAWTWGLRVLLSSSFFSSGCRAYYIEFRSLF